MLFVVPQPFGQIMKRGFLFWFVINYVGYQKALGQIALERVRGFETAGRTWVGKPHIEMFYWAKGGPVDRWVVALGLVLFCVLKVTTLLVREKAWDKTADHLRCSERFWRFVKHPCILVSAVQVSSRPSRKDSHILFTLSGLYKEPTCGTF